MMVVINDYWLTTQKIQVHPSDIHMSYKTQTATMLLKTWKAPGFGNISSQQIISEAIKTLKTNLGKKVTQTLLYHNSCRIKKYQRFPILQVLHSSTIYLTKINKQRRHPQCKTVYFSKIK